MKIAVVEKKVSKEKIAKIVADEKLSKSEKVRQLFDGGLEIKEIAEHLNIRYNFAFNVLQNHIIMNDIVVEKSVRNSKRDEIVKMIQSGMSLADISKATKTNYNYIWKINKELKAETSTTTTPEPTVEDKPKAATKSKKNSAVETRAMSEEEKAKYGVGVK